MPKGKRRNAGQARIVSDCTAEADAVRWRRRAAGDSRRVGSICTGAFLLASAGLLDNRRAATHWAFAAELARRYPKVKVDPKPIWIQDGPFHTSAGVTAGMDLCLALVEEDHGAALALGNETGIKRGQDLALARTCRRTSPAHSYAPG